MSTPSPHDLSLGQGGGTTPMAVPSPDVIAAWANQLFQAAPGQDVPTVPVAGASAVPEHPPVDGIYPSKATQAVPPVSAIGASSPAPGATVPYPDVPRLPFVSDDRLTPHTDPASLANLATLATHVQNSPFAAPVQDEQLDEVLLGNGLIAPGVSVPTSPSVNALQGGAPAQPAANGLTSAQIAERLPGSGSSASLNPVKGESGATFAEVPNQHLGVQDLGAAAFHPNLVPALSPAAAHFDPRIARRDFPILQESINGKPLVWLDNAATTQKPQSVIDRLAYFYQHENSNIHRAAHTLAARATDAYEGAREQVRSFIGAPSTDQIVFVRGTTEAINFIAKTWGVANVGEGDEILITHLEHHANIVPWQQLCQQTGAVLRVAPVDDTGQVIVEEYAKLIGPRTKLVSFTHVSNALGTITPVRELVTIAHARGVPVLLDGAQSVSHIPVNVVEFDVDFFVFSGHKVFGPTGIGAVYAKKHILESMPPWEGGGNMISDVTFERTTFHGPPNRFEAGTGNIADAVGLGAALDYLSRLGLSAVEAYEHGLLDYLLQGLSSISGLTLIGQAAQRASVASFVLDGWKTEDVGTALDKEGIAVRSGHHCAQPILRRFGVEATVRPSLALYNTHDDVDRLIAALERLAGTRR